MAKTYSGLVHLYGNVMAAVDYETTGRRAGYHEIIQMAIVPLNSDLRPLEGVRPFRSTVRPLHPERAEKQAGHVHGLDLNELCLHAPEPDRVKDLLIEWFERLDLPFGKVLVPMAHNSPFEASFTKAFLGIEMTDSIFHSHWRDTMNAGVLMNDRAVFAGQPIPFKRVGLNSMCKKFGITNPKPHDAYYDAVTEAELYRALVLMDLF
jgi:DNA polymerase III epsilon subunit-like protein